MGLLPTYAQIGLGAPILLVTMRVIQGFSVGGEFTGSMVFTTESSSPLMRGLVSSSTAAGVTIGFILGSGSAWAISALLRPEHVSNWGWRVYDLRGGQHVRHRQDPAHTAGENQRDGGDQTAQERDVCTGHPGAHEAEATDGCNCKDAEGDCGAKQKEIAHPYSRRA